jgi:SurA N-terminal domain
MQNTTDTKTDNVSTPTTPVEGSTMNTTTATPAVEAVVTTGTEVVTTEVSTNEVTPSSDAASTDVATTIVTETTSTATTSTTNEGEVTDSAPAPVVANSAASYRRQVLTQYGIAFVIIALMGGALWYMLEEQGRVKTGFFDDIKSLVIAKPAAAKVNGTKIDLALYEKNYAQLVQGAAAQGLDANDPTVAAEMKKQSIDILVNSELLRQAATEAGVVVTDEQINGRYAELVQSQGDETKLVARMTELGITKESLLGDIKNEILIQTHLTAAVDTSKIVVTKEEVEALYNSVASNPEVEVPPLADVQPQIEQEIKFGKEQELISGYIETLKTNATIEVLI